MAEWYYKERDILQFPFVVDNHSLIRTTGGHIDWVGMQEDAADAYAFYRDDETGNMRIPAGTIMKRDSSDQDWVPVNEDVDVSTLNRWGMLEADEYEKNLTSATDNVGILTGAYVYENLLPDFKRGFTTLVSSINGRQAFMLDTYIDSRTA
jgi:hypothetical protein